MTQFNLYFNQINNICIWLNTNTKIVANTIYDGEEGSLHIELKEGAEPLYAHHIDGLKVKREERINLEMSRLIQYLLNLKEEYNEETKI